MVHAYHLIITAYGFWLPNDPRGSWSDFVRAWELVRFGKATKTDERRSLAHRPHDRSFDTLRPSQSATRGTSPTALELRHPLSRVAVGSKTHAFCHDDDEAIRA